ncbi:hypothetical protein [[Phormidium] sp. ETS-05]|uniref:hypothetical protein n=1 Tax=[Phormidium] sp. ETS-05 TaxID=222819 RepID=UPI0018EF161E|nr:hypothetical protein [[Phormidium] sp. ETS-05]
MSEISSFSALMSPDMIPENTQPSMVTASLRNPLLVGARRHQCFSLALLPLPETGFLN